MADAAPRQDPQAPHEIERVAALIREVDGFHSLGAGALAEKLVARGLRAAPPAPSQPPKHFTSAEQSAWATGFDAGLRGGPAPSQEVPPMAERFTALGLLPADWDSYGAPPLDRATILRAESWLAAVTAVPCSDGGVQLEWHSEGLDVEIIFRPDGRAEFYAEAAGLRSPTAEGPPSEERPALDPASWHEWEEWSDVPMELVNAFQEAFERLHERCPSVFATAHGLLAALRAVPSQESTCPDCGGTGRKAPDVGIFRTLPCHCPAGLRAVPSQESGHSELVRFFCHEEIEWGYKGDHENWSTERAAIELIRHLRAELRGASGGGDPQKEGAK